MTFRSWVEFLEQVGDDRSCKDEMHQIRRTQLNVGLLSDEEFRQLVSFPNRSFDERLATCRKELEQRLVELGFPSPFESIVGCESDWRPLPDTAHAGDRNQRWSEMFAPREVVMSGWKFILDNTEPFSHHWFAAYLAQLIHFHDHANAGDRRERAYLIGHTLAIWSSRTHYGTIRRGKKVRSSASRGGQERARKLADTRNAILEQMARYIQDGHSISRAAELTCNSGLGTSRDANRQLWNRWR